MVHSSIVRGLLFLVCLGGLLGGLGCQHAMRVESEPSGAKVLMDGKPVGTTPVTVLVDPGAPDSTVDLTLTSGKKERTFSVKRSQIDWSTLGATALLDAGGCVGICGLSLVAAALLPPLAIGVCAAPLVFGALPFQYLFAGATTADAVKLDLSTGEIATHAEVPAPPALVHATAY